MHPGTSGIEVDTGNGQSPPADGQSPPGVNQEQEADVGAEGNQANADTAGQGGAAESKKIIMIMTIIKMVFIKHLPPKSLSAITNKTQR